MALMYLVRKLEAKNDIPDIKIHANGDVKRLRDTGGAA